MKMITVILQGEEVRAALLSPEVMKKIEDGFTETVRTIEEVGKEEGISGSEGVRKQCKAVTDYVAGIFGEDAVKRVFGEETDYLTCLDVLGEIQRMYPDQVSRIIREKNEALKANMKKSDE